MRYMRVGGSWVPSPRLRCVITSLSQNAAVRIMRRPLSGPRPTQIRIYHLDTISRGVSTNPPNSTAFRRTLHPCYLYSFCLVFSGGRQRTADKSLAVDEAFWFRLKHFVQRE